MRKAFSWYLGPSDEEVEKIWSSGTLTLDANVLLDLYRYNAKTREDILKAIGFFESRVWLSAQAGREFVRNRTRVIASSDKTFRDANAAIEDLRKACIGARDKLRSHRLVPRDGLDEMSANIDAAIDVAADKIKQAEEAHPDYLNSDALLDWVVATFDGRMGKDPTAAEWEEVRKIGEARREARIPPGYEDGGKDGDRKYGDYLLWRQILEHARSNRTPIILVTSERKEDWWEEIGGRTIGPRAELMEEAAAVSGQRILIYQTDRFLQHALAKIGDEVDTSSVDDIREVDAERSRLRQGDYKAVARVMQSMTTSADDLFENAGTAKVEISRAVSNFTATVRLDSDIDWSDADISAQIIKKPTDAPDARVIARVNSSGRLHLHAHPLEKKQFSPGVYEISFAASTWNVVLRSLDDLPTLSSD